MYEIEIDGETEHLIDMDELDHLSVHLSINEGGDLATNRCSGCGEETNQDDMVTFGVEVCEGSDKWVGCPSDHEQGPADEPCELCGNDGEIEIHNWQPIPLHWVNSASIYARPDRDEIQVTISVDDPRGAFVMSVERREDGLYLSVPSAGMSMPHAPLTERSAGWFKIG